MSKDVYLGPYIIAITKTVRSVVTLDGCPKCNRHLYDDFCSKCGSLAEKDIVTATNIDDAINMYEVSRKIKERLAWSIPQSGRDNRSRAGIKVKHYWISNKGFTFKFRDIEFKPVEFEINPELIAGEQEQFLKVYKKELQILIEIYGEEHISLHWGLITSFN